MNRKTRIIIMLFLPSFPLFQALASLPDAEMIHVRDAITENIPEEALRPYFTRLLVAIRKSENGGPGREFGVLHPKADTYRKQAGWCAAIAWRRYEEWKESPKKIAYLVYLRNRYAPLQAENDIMGHNANWLSNVRSHMGRKGQWEPKAEGI